MINSSLFIRFIHWFARESNIQFLLYFFLYFIIFFEHLAIFLVPFYFGCPLVVVVIIFLLFGFVDPAFSEYPVPYPCSYYLAPIVICSHLQNPQEDLKSTRISQCISGFICVIYQSSLIHTI